MSRLLALLRQASKEGHDDDRLRAKFAMRYLKLSRRLDREPSLSARLRRLTEQPEQMRAMDADDLVSALRKVIDPNQPELQDDLLALTLVVARMGGLGCTVRIGLTVVEELRATRAVARQLLH